MPKFKLSKAININGESVTELSYNLEDMTAREKAEATKGYKKAGNMVMVQELDSDYHLYLFAAAVKKENPSIEADDVLRMSAKDSVKAEALVRDFFFIDSEDSSATDTSQDALLN
ncbi:hypothetical protein [Paenibacillus crassostreae]|uniref:Phage tail protein n=1 Tax=Paenibacillus crassostreae TaxID=1763538 RepID=A0A167C5C2_9BACL|nr:hypothetical protein [Paenibacillus crassostreae]AOZ91627.1 hypothetical protein LPB68_04945 [Paenibacillus crassostreae]OAB72799.1 hypothetical protein PNBC_15305 [Paenibacillus crassostreae]